MERAHFTQLPPSWSLLALWTVLLIPIGTFLVHRLEWLRKCQEHQKLRDDLHTLQMQLQKADAHFKMPRIGNDQCAPSFLAGVIQLVEKSVICRCSAGQCQPCDDDDDSQSSAQQSDPIPEQTVEISTNKPKISKFTKHRAGVDRGTQAVSTTRDQRSSANEVTSGAQQSDTSVKNTPDLQQENDSDSKQQQYAVFKRHIQPSVSGSELTPSEAQNASSDKACDTIEGRRNGNRASVQELNTRVIPSPKERSIHGKVKELAQGNIKTPVASRSQSTVAMVHNSSKSGASDWKVDVSKELRDTSTGSGTQASRANSAANPMSTPIPREIDREQHQEPPAPKSLLEITPNQTKQPQRAAGCGGLSQSAFSDAPPTSPKPPHAPATFQPKLKNSIDQPLPPGHVECRHCSMRMPKSIFHTTHAVICKRPCNNCGLLIDGKDFRTHVKACRPCNHCGVWTATFGIHKRICSQWPVNCQFCSKQMPREVHAKHMPACREKRDIRTCNNCGLSVKSIVQHLKTECENPPTKKCEWCQKVVPKRALGDHLKDECPVPKEERGIIGGKPAG